MQTNQAEISFDSVYEPKEIVFKETPRVRVRVGVEPVGWQRPRFNGKRAFTAPKVAKFKELFFACLQAQVPVAPNWDGPVSVDLHFRVPRTEASASRMFPIGKPDIDNLAKGVMDVCNGFLWKDDAQIVAMSLTKSWADASCEIGIEIVARQICSREENERKLPRKPRAKKEKTATK